MQHTHFPPAVEKVLNILKRGHYMKFSSYLILFVLLMLVIFLTWAKPPSGLDLNEELRSRGSVSGYVLDRHGSPVKGVQVSVLEDSAIPGISDENGFYTVGNVTGGIRSLCFSHKDYEGDTALIDQAEGVDDTLTTKVLLSYAYYILAGKVAYKGKPVPGAGVTVVGCPVSAITDDMGKYVLGKVPKNSPLKLICAKSGIGFNTLRPMTVVTDDTTWVTDIELIYRGATVRGTVYDTNGSPASNVVVAAVGGGLVDVTDKNGRYKIENIPVFEPTVRISALEGNSLYGASKGINVRSNSHKASVDIYMRPVSDVQKRKGIGVQVNDRITVDTDDTTAQFTVYPLLDINTLMRPYKWDLAENLNSNNETT